MTRKRVGYRVAWTTILVVAMAGLLASCGSDDDAPASTPSTVASYSIALAPYKEAPPIIGRGETGTATITVSSDDILNFSITVNALDSADALTAAHIHDGDAITAGGIFLGLVDGTNISFSGGSASGSITLNATQVSDLLDTTRDFYVNVHSSQQGGGLIRGQLHPAVVEAANLALSPANAFPAVTGPRFETGMAVVQLLDDDTLAFNLAVNTLTTDTLTIAHIHEGAAGASGPVFIGLVDGSAITFPTAVSGSTSAKGIITLTAAQVSGLQDPARNFYVNIHSTQEGGGLLRAQFDQTDSLAFNVPLTTVETVPLVTGRSEAGSAIVQLKDDNILTFTLTVNNVDAADSLTAAHIHEAITGVAGGVFIGLVDGSTVTFPAPVSGRTSVTGQLDLTATQVTGLLDTTRSFYVNVHSSLEGAGLIRGQIRPDVLTSYNLALSPVNAVPAVTGRSETGRAVVHLLDDDTLAFNLAVNTLDATDSLTVAHIHEGAAGVAGAVFVGLVDGSAITFPAAISGSTSASGNISLTAAQVSGLQDTAREFYVNIHSTQEGGGLLRAQLDQSDSAAFNVPLTTAETVPLVTGRSEAGSATVQLKDDDILTFTLTVNNVDATDTLTAAHIHEALTGVAGPIFIGLVDGSIVTFPSPVSGRTSVTGQLDLTATQVTGMLDTARYFYVNVHSSQEGAGLVRGQLR